MVGTVTRFAVQAGKEAELEMAFKQYKAALKAKEPKILAVDLYRVQEIPLAYMILCQYPDPAVLQSAENAARALAGPMAALTGGGQRVHLIHAA